MNKVKYLPLIILCMLLSGCGAEKNTISTDTPAETAIQTSEIELKGETESSSKNATETTAESTSESDTKTVAEDSSETDMKTETSPVANEDTVNNTPGTKYITIDLSTARETHPTGDAAAPFDLRIVSEEENGIDFANEWYDRKGLSLPMIGTDWNSFYDDNYQYLWSGEELYIFENGTGNCLYVLTYPTDKWHINGNNACLKDGIFYGASVTNGYAQPDTCFMFAYDLENNKLLWRSAGLYHGQGYLRESGHQPLDLLPAFQGRDRHPSHDRGRDHRAHARACADARTGVPRAAGDQGILYRLSGADPEQSAHNEGDSGAVQRAGRPVFCTQAADHDV